ncbi:MAG: hypothetical protein M0C28_27705 [Candidatus Moduliflexus flocculans]|nr:hypothetical protein [Candidatus Moduliflexus flocculans]
MLRSAHRGDGQGIGRSQCLRSGRSAAGGSSTPTSSSPTSSSSSSPDGAIGIGGSPQGETISIYEDKRIGIGPETVIRRLEAAGVLGREIDQAGFDAVLDSEIPRIGRNNAFSLSLAFFNATRGSPDAERALRPAAGQADAAPAVPEHPQRGLARLHQSRVERFSRVHPRRQEHGPRSRDRRP